MKPISRKEVEKRIQAWAEITQLSLELKRAAFRNKYPDFSEQELSDMIREESAQYKVSRDE